MIDQVQTTRLANGLTILTEHMPGLRSASLGIWVRRGSRHETPALNGICHFIEHALFKGTERRSARQIAMESDRLGGHLDAYTSHEITGFALKVVDTALPQAFEQLVRLYGPQAREPRATLLKDWAADLDTATAEDRVASGHPRASDEVWVTANFKETQLTHMRPGQKVTIKVDAYPGQKLEGRVDSIQSGTGARFSLLPPENATGNYVKVVQRIPVKLVFDKNQDAERELRSGMSTAVKVRVK